MPTDIVCAKCEQPVGTVTITVRRRMLLDGPSGETVKSRSVYCSDECAALALTAPVEWIHSDPIPFVRGPYLERNR